MEGFVRNKENTLVDLGSLLPHCTQWNDYMKQILRVVTINSEDVDDFVTSNRVLDQVHYLFRVRDICLPDNDSGYVYVLLSLSNRYYTYIGKSKNIVNRIYAHNAGNRSNAT